ncbi:RNase adapter RapZ [Marimonas sp. MJW-29]|uniref:RNase adapter RapZ n=1 Tax=Sulfitobacter sediminis TaxID=3234186 RepID=A0ABV3RHU2_9RHOB
MNVPEQNSAENPITTRHRVVLVTGPSGAGRSSALNVLEDAGFEAIDNLPLRLLPALLDDKAADRSLAIGIDARTRDFSTNGVLDLLDRLEARSDLAAELLYLDCAPEVLLRRFSETRRRHPMAEGGPPSAGIEREQGLLLPLRARANVLIDTTGLNVHDLRAEVERWFAPGGKHHLSVSVQSFSYKRGLPRSVDMIFDCRFLRNPHWDATLREADGTDARVAAYIAEDPLFAPFAEQVLDLSKLLLPAFREEGKSNLTIAFGCTGGQHRSVAMAEAHALRLAQLGWQVSIRHRELGRRNEG